MNRRSVRHRDLSSQQREEEEEEEDGVLAEDGGAGSLSDGTGDSLKSNAASTSLFRSFVAFARCGNVGGEVH